MPLHYTIIEKIIRNNFGAEGDIDFLEIGVAGGAMERHLLSIFPKIRITCIDTNLCTFSELEQERVKFIQGNSTDVFKDLNTLKLDFLYIDGGHSYEQCKFDIENYSKLVKTGGIIAGHDYVLPHGVVKAVDELLPNRILDDDFVWLIKKES